MYNISAPHFYYMLPFSDQLVNKLFSCSCSTLFRPFRFNILWRVFLCHNHAYFKSFVVMIICTADCQSISTHFFFFWGTLFKKKKIKILLITFFCDWISEATVNQFILFSRIYFLDLNTSFWNVYHSYGSQLCQIKNS